jgi:CBS domain-containing protein
MKVKEMMHTGGEWAAPDAPVTTLAQKMLRHDIGAIPVGENDRLIGMVTDRDITCEPSPKARTSPRSRPETS